MRTSLFLVLALTFATASARADYTVAPVPGGAEIKGKVSLTGTAPVLPPKPRDRNPETCGSSGADESLLIGTGGGVKNAVVYLKDISSGKAMPAAASANFDQKGCTYVPHVLAVPVGSTVNLMNGDPLLHNVHAEGATAFNYAMPMSAHTIPKKLTRPGFLNIKCDVHPWMSGVIAVMENPYFAVTDADGSFSLSNVPAGTYTLSVWHETLGEQSQRVTVPASGAVAASFKLTPKAP